MDFIKKSAFITLACMAVLGFTALPCMNISAKESSKQYIVSKDGTGDFMSIQEAVNASADGDTIIIYPGIYEESVEVMGKALNITGIDKNTCVIRSKAYSYRKQPLTIAKGRVSNLTIYGDSATAQEIALYGTPTAEEIDEINASLVGDSWERQKNYKGYAVHIDQNCLYGNEMVFENCKIISENNHCVGIGNRGKSTVRFEGCDIISMGTGSCIFLHNTDSETMGGESSFILKNSTLTSCLCPYVMTFHSLGAKNITYLTFQNVKVSAVAFADKTGYSADNCNSFDVDLIDSLEKSGLIGSTGFSSSMAKVVNVANLETSNEHMINLKQAQITGNYQTVLSKRLPEGINYIGVYTQGNTKSSTGAISNSENNAYNYNGYNALFQPQLPEIKRHVIAIYNHDNISGSGWCGSESMYLSNESYSNTLYEMNVLMR